MTNFFGQRTEASPIQVAIGTHLRAGGEIPFAVVEIVLARTSEGRSVRVGCALLHLDPDGDAARAVATLPVLTMASTLTVVGDAETTYHVLSTEVRVVATGAALSIHAVDPLMAQLQQDTQRAHRQMLRDQAIILPRLRAQMEEDASG